MFAFVRGIMARDLSNIEQLNIPYPKIKSLKSFRDLPKSVYVIQEKLDGCNFRVIHTKDDAILFGSRNRILQDCENFCNFHTIRRQLEDHMANLKNILSPVDEFMVVGELIGYDKNKMIMPRIKYFEEKEVRFYAYEIFDISKNTFMDFVITQNILEKSGFNVIPIKFYDWADENISFKSLLFPQLDEMEGYIVRGKPNNIYKILSDRFRVMMTADNSNDNPQGNKNQNSKASILNFVTDYMFLNYLSKGPIPEADRFHQNLCQEIIEDYLDQPGEHDKIKSIKQKGDVIFAKTYGLIQRNKKLIENFDEIFQNYDIRKSKEEFLEYVKSL